MAPNCVHATAMSTHRRNSLGRSAAFRGHRLRRCGGCGHIVAGERSGVILIDLPETRGKGDTVTLGGKKELLLPQRLLCFFQALQSAEDNGPAGFGVIFQAEAVNRLHWLSSRECDLFQEASSGYVTEASLVAFPEKPGSGGIFGKLRLPHSLDPEDIPFSGLQAHQGNNVPPVTG